ncbi:MAG: CBS domain-containing protein, partial [Caldimonas sp.]
MPLAQHVKSCLPARGRLFGAPGSRDCARSRPAARVLHPSSNAARTRTVTSPSLDAAQACESALGEAARWMMKTEVAMRVGEICTRLVVTCRPGASVLELAQLMRDHHTGDVIVVDEQHGLATPVGVVTDRDLV